MFHSHGVVTYFRLKNNLYENCSVASMVILSSRLILYTRSSLFLKKYLFFSTLFLNKQ